MAKDRTQEANDTIKGIITGPTLPVVHLLPPIGYRGAIPPELFKEIYDLMELGTPVMRIMKVINSSHSTSYSIDSVKTVITVIKNLQQQAIDDNFVDAVKAKAETAVMRLEDLYKAVKIVRSKSAKGKDLRNVAAIANVELAVIKVQLDLFKDVRSKEDIKKESGQEDNLEMVKEDLKKKLRL